MKQDEALTELTRRADALGVKLYKVCAAAGISPSTYYRWQTGSKAGMDNVAAVDAELTKLERVRKSK